LPVRHFSFVERGNDKRLRNLLGDDDGNEYWTININNQIKLI
jgi:hypothetical protein